MMRLHIDSLERRQLLASISGTIFNDRNNNAVYDAAGPDLGLGGVAVFLDANNNALLDSGEATTTSASMTSGNWGRYTFSGLGVGTYRVQMVVPAGYEQTAPSGGLAREVSISNASFAALGVNLGARDLAQSSRLSANVWRDDNGNGTRETAEPLLANFRAWVDLDQDGQRDASEPDALTNASGRFVIDAPNPNFTTTYQVRVDPPLGFEQTTLGASNGVWSVTIDAGNATLPQNLFGFRDVAPPAVAQSRYDVDASPNRIVFDLTEPSVNTSWTVGFALTVRANGTGPALSFTLDTNAAGELSYRYAGPGPTLPDGNNTATLAAGTLRDSAGNTNNQPHTFNFHVLAGDVNRDRAVNFDDLLILAQNYGQSGRSFSHGNVDYSADGVVGFDDLLLLAQRYGTSLVASTTPVSGRKRPSAFSELA